VVLPMDGLPSPVRAASAISAASRALSAQEFETAITAETGRAELPANPN